MAPPPPPLCWAPVAALAALAAAIYLYNAPKCSSTADNDPENTPLLDEPHATQPPNN